MLNKVFTFLQIPHLKNLTGIKVRSVSLAVGVQMILQWLHWLVRCGTGCKSWSHQLGSWGRSSINWWPFLNRAPLEEGCSFLSSGYQGRPRPGGCCFQSGRIQASGSQAIFILEIIIVWTDSQHGCCFRLGGLV